MPESYKERQARKKAGEAKRKKRREREREKLGELPIFNLGSEMPDVEPRKHKKKRRK